MSGQVPDANAPLERPNFPQHLFAKPSSSVDMNQVKPHACMERVEQRGNYIHCFAGNHGMRIPHGKVLNKDVHGNWILEDILVRDEEGNPIYHPDDKKKVNPLTLQEFVKVVA